jgi:hypothetical protein
MVRRSGPDQKRRTIGIEAGRAHWSATMAPDTGWAPKRTFPLSQVMWLVPPDRQATERYFRSNRPEVRVLSGVPIHKRPGSISLAFYAFPLDCRSRLQPRRCRLPAQWLAGKRLSTCAEGIRADDSGTVPGFVRLPNRVAPVTLLNANGSQDAGSRSLLIPPGGSQIWLPILGTERLSVIASRPLTQSGAPWGSGSWPLKHALAPRRGGSGQGVVHGPQHAPGSRCLGWFIECLVAG